MLTSTDLRYHVVTASCRQSAGGANVSPVGQQKLETHSEWIRNSTERVCPRGAESRRLHEYDDDTSRTIGTVTATCLHILKQRRHSHVQFLEIQEHKATIIYYISVSQQMNRRDALFQTVNPLKSSGNYMYHLLLH
jgi:hypothetical protein